MNRKIAAIALAVFFGGGAIYGVLSNEMPPPPATDTPTGSQADTDIAPSAKPPGDDAGRTASPYSIELVRCANTADGYAEYILRSRSNLGTILRDATRFCA